ncbi:MAG: hypothetical protein CMJ48_04555 [Planctomycetaceae bacterium]|nr:hypothetical protein [Planctomycetaceae bacterium]
MESLRRTSEQFSGLYQSMTPSQRGTLIVIPLLIVGAFALMMFNGSGTSMTAVSYGKTFKFEELVRAEEAFRLAGLNDWEPNGRLLMVPAKQVDKYNAALAQAGSLPADWTEELLAQIDKASLFGGSKELEARKDALLKKTLRKMLLSSDVEEVILEWARTKQRSFRMSGPLVTASVTLRPKPGREISRNRMISARSVVASAIPDLEPRDVTVMDPVSGRTISGDDDDDDALDNKIVQRIAEFQRDWQQRVESYLRDIKDANVAVTVDLDNVQRLVEQQRKYSKSDFATVRSDEATRTLETSSAPTGGEAGVQPNQATSLPGLSGTQSQTTDKDTRTILDQIPSSTITYTETLAAMPKAIKVSVSIPKSHYAAIAAADGVTEGESDAEKTDYKTKLASIQTEVETRVKNGVANLLPTKPETIEDVINVSSFTAVDNEPVAVETPITETVSEVAGEWGGAVVLVLFAAWALRMLNKSMPQVTAAAESGAEPFELPAMTPMDTGETAAEDDASREPTARDNLQVVVRDNPEMAASMVGKWIQSEL